MNDVNIYESVSQMKYYGPSYDILETQYNKRKNSELMPQTRRPKAISKAYAFLKAQGVINEEDGK